jgi:antirestriction protein ArdC
MNKEQIEKLTTELLNRLENTKGDWKVPFATGTQRNALSLKPYRGFNQIITSLSEYTDPRWIGFKQCSDLGGSVKKGEKSTHITRWIPRQESTEEVEEGKGKGFLATHTIFNVEQTNLLEIEKLPVWIPPTVKINPNSTQETVQALKIDLRESLQGRAYYSSLGDYIHLPLPDLFEGQGAYDATFAHELGHWTGHESRMARALGNCKNTNAYALEELIAETFALLYCREFGIGYERPEEYHVVDNNILYIKAWLQALKNDPSHVLKACTSAYNAFEWVCKELGVAQEEWPPEEVEVTPPKPKQAPKIVKPQAVKKEAVATQEHPPFKLKHDQQKAFDKWRKLCEKQMPNEQMTVEYIASKTFKEREYTPSKRGPKYEGTTKVVDIVRKDILKYTIGTASTEFYECIDLNFCTGQEIKEYDRKAREAKAFKTLGLKNGVLLAMYDFGTHFFIVLQGNLTEQAFVKSTKAVKEAIRDLEWESTTPNTIQMERLLPIVEKLRTEEWEAEEHFHKEILMNAQVEAVKAKEKFSPSDPYRGFTPFKIKHEAFEEWVTEQPVQSYEVLQRILKANKIVRLEKRAIFFKTDKRKEIFRLQAAV